MINMPYRIRQKFDGYMEGKYYVQKQVLGFLWWTDITEEQCCIDGLCWHERIWFDTVEEADKFIDRKYGYIDDKDPIIHTRNGTGITDYPSQV